MRESGSFVDGISLENNQTIFIINKVNLECLPNGFEKTNDNKILSCALELSKELDNLIFLSRDISQRIKCDSLGIRSEDYSTEKAKVERSAAYTGVSVITVDEENMNEFYSEGGIECEYNLMPNEYVVLKAEGRGSALGRKINQHIQKLNHSFQKGESVQGIRPRNKEQRFALDMLLDERIQMVTITGMAGSGKTILTCAAAIDQVFRRQYKKIIISRPVKSMSADIGFLPGPQPLDAKILTPEGWTTMGEIKVGDYVISRDGSKAKVLNIFPKGLKNVYKLTTTSGISAESCGDHIWATRDFEEKKRGKEYSLKTLNQIKETLKTVKDKKEKLNHYLPRNEAVSFNHKEVGIPPYTLGVLLGDGSISNSISVINTDKELLEKFHWSCLKLDANFQAIIIFNIIYLIKIKLQIKLVKLSV